MISLEKLRKGTEAVGKGDLQHRIGLLSNDELGDLARDFDLMSEKLQTITVSWDELGAEVAEHRKTEQSLTVELAERRKAEEALRASLEDKEVLMRELAHRTKNNMQVIAGLLSLQAAASTEGRFAREVSEIQNRIRAMALVHEKIYRSGNFASLNMKDYVHDLIYSILRTHQGEDGPVKVEFAIEDVVISIDAAVPCGLIINELVSNSLKHAFPIGKPGRIYLSMRRVGMKFELKYRDDGPGPPRDLDLSMAETLGLKLAYNLASAQLRGTMELRWEPVWEFVIEFGVVTSSSKD
jgi:two-component sensor histidine kinase